MENISTMTRTASPVARVSLLPCAASDVRTSVWGIDVRGAYVADIAAAKRDRVATIQTPMGHTGAFAGVVPGFQSWSPPS